MRRKVTTLNKNDTTILEKVKKRSWVPNPQEHFGEENVKPGDNSRYLRYALASLDLPPIDISDPDQVEKRIYEYFQFCVENDRKPNMVGMANWIGIDPETLRTWKNGQYRSSTHSGMIKKAIMILEEMWVDYMQNGKLNPASGIFLAKNMFGMLLILLRLRLHPLETLQTKSSLKSGSQDLWWWRNSDYGNDYRLW